MLRRHRPPSPVIDVHVREGAAEMNIDIRLLPGLFEESFCQISAADAFSSQGDIGILLLVGVAVGAL